MSARDTILSAVQPALVFLQNGGPAIWAIGFLSVLTLALILGKMWHLVFSGVWRLALAEQATSLWQTGQRNPAMTALEGLKNPRARLALAAMQSVQEPEFSDLDNREETTRVARKLLAETGSGLRVLELIATIAPLLGLLGTVLGMIEAFQALQSSGSRADPAALAGGIWEALLTTAAGMGVAIPASMALSWFESLRDTLARDMEDLATRILLPGSRATTASRAATGC
jgi:biopolymer transport protein ExbB